jgi:hypothetical protein
MLADGAAEELVAVLPLEALPTLVHPEGTGIKLLSRHDMQAMSKSPAATPAGSVSVSVVPAVSMVAEVPTKDHAIDQKPF